MNVDDFFKNDISSHVEILLHPNIPKPLHGLAPRTIMGKKWWDAIRRESYAEHDYKCAICGKPAPYDLEKLRFDNEEGVKLEAHEIYDINYLTRRATYVKTLALCNLCHNYIHSGRLNALFDKGVFDEEYCWTVMTHGDSVLIDASISPFLREVDQRDYKDEWMEWRLVFEGNEYEPIYKSYEEWNNEYNKKEGK